MAELTTKHIKQFKDLTKIPDLSPSDLLLLQDVSDETEPYKKTTVSDIGDTVINEYDLANKAYADSKVNDTTASPKTAYSSEKTESFVHDYVKENTAKSENFSTDQWNAINSGITASLLEELQRLTAQGTFDIIFPAGKATIVQFPVAYDMATHTIQYNTADPNIMYNGNGISSTWVELDYDGAFFRANGGFAETFGSGVQTAELPNVTGALGYAQFMGGVYSRGAFRTSNRGGLYSAYDGNSDQPQNIYIDLSNGQTNNDGSYKAKGSSTYKDGGEARPTNYTIKIWRRTA